MSTTQLDNTLTFETTAAGIESADLHLTEMRGFEALSTPYEFKLTLESVIEGENPALDAWRRSAAPPPATM